MTEIILLKNMVMNLKQFYLILKFVLNEKTFYHRKKDFLTDNYQLR